MLVKVEEGKFINADFIVSLSLLHEQIGKNNTIDSATHSHIVACMIDGSKVTLLRTKDRHLANTSYTRIIEEANQLSK